MKYSFARPRRSPSRLGHEVSGHRDWENFRQIGGGIKALEWFIHCDSVRGRERKPSLSFHLPSPRLQHRHEPPHLVLGDRELVFEDFAPTLVGDDRF